jgi:SAM-dependent methyltransferase
MTDRGQGHVVSSGRGLVFGTAAAEYNRTRPGYPSRLVDSVARRARLHPGSRVLEIGCGTGQLTRSLLRRGYHVHAIEPDPRMAAHARCSLSNTASAHHAQIEVVEQMIEEAHLPESAYDAAFSASAFHWVDPDVGWLKVGHALRPGGRFSLLGHLIVEDAWSSASMHGLLEIYERRADTSWPIRSAAQVVDGTTQRWDDISMAWAFAESMRPMAGRGAKDKFGDPALDLGLWRTTFTAAELIELQSTRSVHIRLAPEARAAAERDLATLVERLGGVFRQTHLSIALSGANRPGAAK